MGRLLYALAVGVVGAGLVHVGITLMLPGAIAERAWTAVVQALPLEGPRRLVRPVGPLAAENPFLLTAICRFDLARGPLSVTASGRVAGWSVAIFAPDGRALSGLNDRMSPAGVLDLRLEREVMEPAGESAAPTLDGPLRVPVPTVEGLLAVRVLVSDPSWGALAEDFLSRLACRR